MQAIQKTLLVPGDEEETSGLRKETCLLGHRDVEIGAIFRCFVYNSFCSNISGLEACWNTV